MSMERLDKIIASQSTFTRKDARNLIKDGVVCVNGKTMTGPDESIDTEKDEITLFGKVFIVKKFVYIMLNKPAGILSAAKDARAKTVIDLVPLKMYRRDLFPTGRLDKDTTGFMLITDDGDFAHRILSPKNHVFKTYEGKIIQSGFRSKTTGTIQSYEFDFSVQDKAIADSLMRCGGKEVELSYKEYLGVLPWRGVSKYVVDKILAVHE